MYILCLVAMVVHVSINLGWCGEICWHISCIKTGQRYEKFLWITAFPIIFFLLAIGLYIAIDAYALHTTMVRFPRQWIYPLPLIGLYWLSMQQIWSNNKPPIPEMHRQVVVFSVVAGIVTVIIVCAVEYGLMTTAVRV